MDPQFGTLLREIQAQTDSSDNVLDYIVSLTRYNYAHDDAGVISALRPSGMQALQSVQNYWSFEIAGTDPTGLRGERC
jgi:glycogen debranching enzyme